MNIIRQRLEDGRKWFERLPEPEAVISKIKSNFTKLINRPRSQVIIKWFQTNQYLFKYNGTEVLVHYSLKLWFLFITCMTFLLCILHPIVFIISVSEILLKFTTILTIITMHEFAHAETAKYFKHGCKRIYLNTLGGVALIDSTELFKNPVQEFVVAIAGPLSNLVMCIICYPMRHLAGIDFFFHINFLVFAFNLLPVLPMDGGRLLRSTIFYFNKNFDKATVLSLYAGLMTSALAMLCGVPNAFIVMIIAGLMFVTYRRNSEIIV